MTQQFSLINTTASGAVVQTNLDGRILNADVVVERTAVDYHYIRDYSAIDLTSVKQGLRIDSDDNSSDTVLLLTLNGVKEHGDRFIDQPTFASAESGLSVAIPADVDLWVLQTTMRFFEMRFNGVQEYVLKDADDMKWDKVDYTMLKPYRNFWGIS